MSEGAVKAGKNGERSGVGAGRQKKSSFQITSVTATRMSNDGGDDSADDLDESHTDDISRVTEGENETPSFSEDTFSKDDVFFNTGSTSLGSAPVIPTSSQYGLAIVPTHDAPAPGPDAVDVINIGNVKTEASDAHVTTRNERFKVVKIESTEPFKRGRWQCMDYLDHSGYDEDNHHPEHSIQINIPKPVPAQQQQQPTQAQNMSQNSVPNAQGQPQSMPHQQIQQVVQPVPAQPVQAASMPHSQPQINGPVQQQPQQQQQPTPTMQNNPNQISQVSTMIPASQSTAPQSQQPQLPNMVPASQPQQQQSMVPGTQGPQQMPNMVPVSSQPQQQQQQISNVVPAQQHPQQIANMVPASQTQVTNMVGAPQPQQQQQQQQQQQVPNMVVPTPTMVPTNQQPTSQVTNIVPQTQQQLPTAAGQSQGQQMPLANQSQPPSLTAMPQAMQQAGQQQMQQQLMQQQLQQQMQYFPQAMHQGAGMMGMGHPMQQYPVQMPASYGQPSYVPTMPQLLPQQMMQPNFQNFQQHPPQPASTQNFPNAVTASGGMGYNQSSQPVMSYTNQPQHPGMAYPQVMVPQMVQQQVPQVASDHASDLQVSVALLESLVEATASSEQVQPNDDAESLFHSRLAQALAVYRERVSAARLAQAAPSRAPSPSPSASGTSAVAIDNKIEQAMDLVKSHLMFAVREEVEVLREKIAELMDRISLLEMENAVLKSQATAETLATLAAQVPVTSKTPAPGGGGGGAAPN